MSAIATLRDVQHTYLEHTPLTAVALRGAELTVYQGEMAALVGPSGAGKSTLLHFLNGLLRPTATGHVIVFGQDTGDPRGDMIALRRRVGLVFQYPHQQLFERYAGDDVAYGPRQQGLSGEQVRETVRWAMETVGLDFAAFVDRQTFSLSGGEMRRLALAGVLAMRPELLVLDEATAGLDPRGRRDVHHLLRHLRDEEGITILLVSNDMDEVAALADRVTVLHGGRTVAQGLTREVLADRERLLAYGLTGPAASEIAHILRSGGLDIDPGAITVAEVEEAIWQAMTR